MCSVEGKQIVIYVVRGDSVISRKVERESTSLAPHNMQAQLLSTKEKKYVELYCETCEETICLKCGTRGGKHVVQMD